jgi:hypothetical protein
MRKSLYMTLIFAAVVFLSSAFALPPAGQEMPILSIEGWRRSGEPEIYKRDGLYGYIDGGAEIFFQYGFRELSVTRYAATHPAAAYPGKAAPKTVTLEIYRMDSPADAFGIFSVRRAGNEDVSPAIRIPHWTSGGQASLVKGDYFINIHAEGLADEEIRAFVASVSARISAPVILPAPLSWLPQDDLIPESERYIRGALAAAEESPLLDREFWGFDEGTRAVSGRYEPSGAKLVIVRLPKETANLTEMVRALFREYLDGVGADDEFVWGKNAAGRWFVLKHKARWAYLVLGAPDPESARLLIRQSERTTAAGVPPLRPRPY